MTVLISSLEFVGACLLVGLGLFLGVDAVGQLRRGRVLALARSAAAALAGLIVVAAAGSYWISMAIR